jgi:transposase InsO family protein
VVESEGPLRQWLARLGAKAVCITPGGPWGNGYCESFSGKPRDELLDGEIFYTPREAQALMERWRVHDNTIRPHSALGYRPPAPEIIVPGEELPMNHKAA